MVVIVTATDLRPYGTFYDDQLEHLTLSPIPIPKFSKYTMACNAIANQRMNDMWAICISLNVQLKGSFLKELHTFVFV